MTHGSALVSIQHITGEALPVSKRVGDEIPAGAVNSDGALVVRTTRDAEHSTPARIARLTEAAQNRRPAVSRLLDTFGDRYSKAILGITLATMVLGPVVFGIPFMGKAGAMYRAFAFLSAAAPCALLMSPLVYVAAVGACARRGVLVRGGLTLDALAECGAVALDKTGTITTGQMACASVERVGAVKTAALVGAETYAEGAEDASSERARGPVAVSEPPASSPAALAIAANLERGATHPIARAVLAAAARAADAGHALPAMAVTEFKVVHGSGVEGLVVPVDGAEARAFGPPRRARFGNPAWASEIAGDHLRATRAVTSLAELRSGDGDITAALVVASGPALARNGASGSDVSSSSAWSSENLTRVFRFADAVHPKAAAATAALRAGAWRADGAPMRVLMLTGDNQASAFAVADAVGLPRADTYAGLTPSEKLRLVEKARADAKRDGASLKKYARVAMVGDGINDAPALAAADVGVAVASTPSEAAAAAADVLLLHADADGISQLPDVFALAARTRRVLKQNITLAIVSIVGAALPALTGAFPLWLAVLLHEGSTLLVALNSVRLLGTFGAPQKMRRSTMFATLFVFALCCAGGAWLVPTVRSAALFNAAGIVATPAFAVAATTLKSAWAGLLAGCLHTLTGPDHLAALTPLSVGPSRAQNALMGALWGCGHNTGQMLFGLAFVLLKDKLPFDMEIIGQWAGIVGARYDHRSYWWEARAMAPARAALALALARPPVRHRQGHVRRRAHALALAPHSHGLPFGIGKDMFGDGHTHSHSHSHDDGDAVANLRFAHAHAESGISNERNADNSALDADVDAEARSESSEASSTSPVDSLEEEARKRKKDGSFLSWTYITGTIHGLQPDALLLLLPAFALPRLQAVAFLGTFFVGTVVAMGTYTACLGAGTSALQKHNPKAVSLVSGISSAVAVAIGVAFILGAVFGFEIF